MGERRMGRNDRIIAALCEAGYPPQAEGPHAVRWMRGGIPPFDVYERAVRLCDPDSEVGITAEQWATYRWLSIDRNTPAEVNEHGFTCHWAVSDG